MMKHLYKVEYDVRYEAVGWNEKSMNVVANSDGTKAIAIVKRKALRLTFEEYHKRKARWIHRKATGFRLTGLQQIALVDL